MYNMYKIKTIILVKVKQTLPNICKHSQRVVFSVSWIKIKKFLRGMYLTPNAIASQTDWYYYSASVFSVGEDVSFRILYRTTTTRGNLRRWR